MFHFPPRRILAPVDTTLESMKAYRAALFVARRFGARLEVVHCLPPQPAELAVYAGAELRRRELVRGERLRRRLDGADAVHVAHGDPARTILNLAEARKADLIVMGTHGRRGATRAVMGSVAEAVLHRAKVPVLVVRKGFRPPRHVLAPIRSDIGAARGLAAAGYVARAFNARLDVLHVVTDPIFGEGGKHLIERRLRALPGEVRRDTRPVPVVRTGRPVREILRATRGRDLVVLVERSRSMLEDLFVGTTAERVSRRSPIPLLTIPPDRRRRRAPEP